MSQKLLMRREKLKVTGFKTYRSDTESIVLNEHNYLPKDAEKKLGEKRNLQHEVMKRYYEDNTSRLRDTSSLLFKGNQNDSTDNLSFS